MPSHWSEFLPRPACRTTASNYRTGVSSAIADNATVAKENGDEGVLRDEDLGVQGWILVVTSWKLLF